MIAATLLAAILQPAAAHAVQPGLLGVTRTGHHVDLRWTPPLPDVPGLAPVLPPECTTEVRVPDRVWSLECPTDARLTMTQLGVPVVVRLESPDHVTTGLLTPDTPALLLTPSAPETTPLSGWIRLGAGHVLSGADHLLFLAGLLLLARPGEPLRRPLTTITAFTLAHSVTLAASVLGWVHIPRAPVEACIALSIVFVAREAAIPGRPRAGPRLAAAFGLLHGLGFAAGLDAAGVPAGDLPRALFGFNVGVEAGQLVFVGGVVLGAVLFRKITAARFPLDTLRPWLAGALGIIGAWWVWERVAGFGAG